MPEIKPLRGVRYNLETVKDLAPVLAPPYDVVSPPQRTALIEASPYNIVNIEAPVDSLKPQEGDPYERAAKEFRSWLAKGVLKKEDKDAMYICQHTFSWEGRSYARNELYVKVRLEPWGSGILPHEHTLPEPKLDRLNLMKACKANISPIYGLYRDANAEVAEVMRRAAKGSASERIKEWRGSSITLSPVTDPAAVSRLSELLASSPIFIADGHHRYETALAYREIARVKEGPGERASDYVLMALTEASDPGLVILPIHRLVRGLSESILDGLRSRLGEVFNVERLPIKEASLEEDLERATNYASTYYNGVPVFLLYGLEPVAILVLRPSQPELLRQAMPADWPRPLKELDVTLLHWAVIGPMLEIPPDAAIVERHLDFTQSHREAIQKVSFGEAQLAFLMQPTRVDQVLEVAGAGAKMPQKSTFFYPKLPTGLVMHLLDE